MPTGRKDYEYFAYLNDQQVLATLLRIDKNMDKMAVRGDAAFQKVGKGSTKLGGVMQGAVMGAVGALTNAFVNMASQAGAAIGSAIKNSVALAAELNNTERKFVTLFEGNEDMASAVMDRIGEKAVGLGLDMGEALSLSRSFIPDVKGLDDPLGTIENLLVGVRALAEEDPAQGMLGARIAIDEAMSGTLSSLKRRFEFTKAEIDILKQAQKELGDVAGTVEGINQVMQRRGFDIAALEGTYTQAVNQMGAATKKLQTTFGTPISASFTENMGMLMEIMTENEDELELFADAMGRVIASITDFVGENLADFLKALSGEDVVKLAEALFDMVEQGKALATILFGIEWSGDFIDTLTGVVEDLDKAFTTASQLAALGKASIARRKAEEEVRAEQGLTTAGGLISFAGTEEQEAEQVAAGEEAYREALLESVKIMEEATQAKEDNRKATEEFRKEQEKNTEALADEANAWLAAGGAAKASAEQFEQLLGQFEEAVSEGDVERVDELAEALQNEAAALNTLVESLDEEAVALRESSNAAMTRGEIELGLKLADEALEAQNAADSLRDEAAAAKEAAAAAAELEAVSEDVTKAQEKMAEIRKDYDRDVEDAHKKHARAMADLDVEIAEKRLDAEKENGRKVAEIHRKTRQDLEDNAREWGQEQADIAKEQARERADFDQESAKKRIQIETDFRDKMLDIRRQFDMRLEDAEEAQDAIAFIRAIKERERAVEEAKKEREEKKVEIEGEISEQRAAMEEENRREIEDAQEVNRRELEEVQIRLQRELEAQRINHQQEMADIVTFEERKRAEINQSLDRQIEDAATKRDRNMEDLRESLDEEVLAFLDKEAAKTAAMKEGSEERIRTAQEEAAAIAAAYADANASAGAGTSFHQNNLSDSARDVSDYYASGGGGIPQFAIGGFAPGGRAAVVGERGPELFIPRGGGNIVPNNKVAPYLSQQVGRSVTNNLQLQQSLHNPAILSPEQQKMTEAISKRMALETVQGFFGGSAR